MDVLKVRYMEVTPIQDDNTKIVENDNTFEEQIEPNKDVDN